MELTIDVDDLASYTASQLNHLFPDRHAVAPVDLARPVRAALDRVEHCFARISRPDYSVDGEARFDVLHSDQYCAYLYFLANTVYRREGPGPLARKLFCLNKALHAINCLYDVELPDVFFIAHAVGTTLGKACYGNYLVVMHGCTVGALGGEYPVLGERLILCAGASIIGPCRIGDNVLVGPGCQVLKTDVPSDTRISRAGEMATVPNTDRPARAYFRL